MTKSAALQWLSRLLYYVLPNFGNFAWVGSQNVIQGAAYNQPIGGAAIGWISVYAILYCAALLGISIGIFARRDFK